MDKFLEIWTKSLDNGEHKKLLEIVLSIFILISPSFSFVFMYKRDLFNKLDNIKLILLCLTINISLFLVFYFLVLWESYQNKLLIKLKGFLEIKENEGNNEALEENEQEQKDKVREAKIETLIKVTYLIFMVSIFPFVTYILNYFTHWDDNYNKTIHSYYVMVLTILVVSFLKGIICTFKLKRISKELKEHDIKINIW
nr:hypothetical protein [[Eubacterium] tenue]